MPADFEVRGAEQFLALSKALKAAGQTEMRKEMNAELRKAAKPLIQDTRSAALQTLPKRGGLAALVAREPQRVQIRTGTKTAGMRIVVGRRRGGAQATNRGQVRHPVFGNSKAYVNQQVPSGWFDDTLAGSGPKVRPYVEAALNHVAQEIARKAR